MSNGAVLLVEDSKDVRNVIAEIVSHFGYDVTKAIDGIDAWSKIAHHQYDLVISDMGLPNMGGEELVRKMRIENINIPVILIAGVDIKKGKNKLDDLSHYSFIRKPFKIEELQAEISRHLVSPGVKL
ncbi:MAG: response regulator [candidate division Zixibacteria bacterium]